MTTEHVLDALRSIIDPDIGRDIVSLGFVKEVTIEDRRVSVVIQLTTPACPVKDQLKQQAVDAISALPGVEEADVSMTAAVYTPANREGMIPGVKHVVAVASGKGGVGKSTVACNLAVALAQSGASVGLLDADIYGPSVPLMMGADEEPEFDGEHIMPLYRYGVKLMSMGFFLEADRAVVWRGPMIGKALQQFLNDVAWGELDYLIVDLPPGTGDASMSLAQLIPITGVVIVMTPQDLAQKIAYKAVLMFEVLGESAGRPVPILGVVENMSGFVCPKCGTVTHPFGSAGANVAAERLGVPLLGIVPMDPTVTAAGDTGHPAILVEPESVQAEAFRSIAGQVAARVSAVSMAAQTSS
ncbi:MAG: Mrp/NBP35 family ATP-binding protein [Chthonomonadales bacterium]|nr:Mrp/NBP35 family ATP-binding protein [Chthonomonadales bacterium]